MANDIVRGVQTPMSFEAALARGVAALNAVALSSPGPASREWSEAADFLRCVLRSLREPNPREMPSGRPPVFG